MSSDKFPIRSHFPMPDTVDCGPQDPSIWGEPPVPSETGLADRRASIKQDIFNLAFEMPGWDEAQKGVGPIPFYELSPEAVSLLPEALRLSYEAELASAKDPRSGPRVVPYSSVKE